MYYDSNTLLLVIPDVSDNDYIIDIANKYSALFIDVRTVVAATTCRSDIKDSSAIPATEWCERLYDNPYTTIATLAKLFLVSPIYIPVISILQVIPSYIINIHIDIINNCISDIDSLLRTRPYTYRHNYSNYICNTSLCIIKFHIIRSINEYITTRHRRCIRIVVCNRHDIDKIDIVDEIHTLVYLITNAQCAIPDCSYACSDTVSTFHSRTRLKLHSDLVSELVPASSQIIKDILRHFTNSTPIECIPCVE